MESPSAPGSDRLAASNFSALDTSSLTSRTYDRLLASIVSRELPPGTPLSVEKLARVFGISRTPVQMAVSRLAEIGLVEVRPRKGTFVARLTSQDVSELFEIRCFLETSAVKKGILILSAEDRSRLKALCRQLDDYSEGDRYLDYYAFLEKDRLFHSALVALARNQRLLRIYDQARILIEVARASADRQIHGAALTRTRHHEIVESLLAGEVEKTISVLEKHIRESEEAIQARLRLLTG